MKRILNFIRSNYDNIITGLLFLLCIVVIVYFFPREGKFQYEFQKGRPWLHENMIAPFSFPIYKSEEELLAEEDSILKEFKPYFNYDSTIIETETERFNNRFNSACQNFLLENHEIEDEAQLNEYNWIHRKLIRAKEQYNNFALNLMEFVDSIGIVQVTDVLDRVS